ncbi:MAG: malto-oligosyltrehalose trehalohydrolase [Deltaproteobacteria bacterium]|nr:malto-oligosyltrehalose trehalohydrolase [Deltaproteobacteria bacterium]
MSELPSLGAFADAGGVLFRVYVTSVSPCRLRLLHDDGTHDSLALTALGDGVFELYVPGVRHGQRYQYELAADVYPDPFSRWQPEGVHAPSSVYTSGFTWHHAGVHMPMDAYVLYELHVGTFTAQGSYSAAADHLEELAKLGITAIELMPLAAPAGQRGWGYDGVALFAPFAAYGAPDELRAFIDRAHGLGMAVILDVVYNHLGPAGNYLPKFSGEYFTAETKTLWGDAPDFGNAPMRNLVIQNVKYWLEEFHFDGLRLDATHAIVDPSERHILAEIASLANAYSPARVLFAEDNRNDPKIVTDAGLSALWTDDFHHQVRVTLTGEQDGYYAAYAPGVAGLAQTINRGWFYEGQGYGSEGEPRGESADCLPAERFIYFIQNHDQVGNRPLGDRLTHTVSLDQFCAASTLLLFLPMTPLIFMGQEWAASSPFLYFTDHDAELGEAIERGRRQEFQHMTAFADASAQERIPNPQLQETFVRSKLNWEERERPGHKRVLQLYKRLLQLRRTDPVLTQSRREQLLADARGDVLRVHRWRGPEQRLLLVNFGGSRQSVEDIVGQSLSNVWQEVVSSEVDVTPHSTPIEYLAPGTALVLSAKWPTLQMIPVAAEERTRSRG